MVESSVSARVKRRRLLGCSVVALTVGMGGAAFADCLPAAPAPSTPVSCSGTTTEGLLVTASGVVNIEAGALLLASPTRSAGVMITSPNGATYGTSVQLNVNGTISGNANQVGVVVQSTSVNNSFPSTRADIVVGETGRIEASKPISLYGQAYFDYTSAAATLDNSGLIASPNYFALSGGVQATGFTTVNNRASGVIRGASGAILASIGVLTNEGLIDGEAGAAYRFAYDNTSFTVYPQSVVNTGVMRSASGWGVISLPVGSVSITNSGSILNTGVGPAIEGGGYLTVTNGVGGVIQSAGTTAINLAGGSLTNQGIVNGSVATSGFLQLTNGGTINGSVATSATNGSLQLTNRGTINGSIQTNATSVVDNTNGVINGAVRFGAGDDLLIATWDFAAGRVAGVSGAIDGGGGINTLRFGVSQDTVLDDMMRNLVLPANFQRAGLMIAAGATATLNVDAPDDLQLGGYGQFTTTGKVTGLGPAFTTSFGPPWDYNASLGFKNTGEITSTFSASQRDGYAVGLQNLKGFENTGTIQSDGGNGVLANFLWPASGAFSNSGTIIASGTALNVSLGGADFVNSGTIQSREGLALTVGNSGSVGSASNSGAIEGATGGVEVSYGLQFTNTGTIKATSGVAVRNNGVLKNKAGGVITGSTASITSYSGARVVNAGVLNGDVDFSGVSYTSNVYVDEGGALNGALKLGGGSDVFVADVGAYANGKFTNITGAVDAGDGLDQLILRVGADTAAKVAVVPTFERIGYELSDGATLTLTADQTITKTLTLAGKGKVDLTADLNVTDALGIVVTAPFDGGYFDPGEISIVSRGALSFTAANGYPTIGVILGAKSTFENVGSITVVGRALTTPPTAAISGGALVTNSGKITLDGAAGTSGVLKVVNTGDIVQSASGRWSYGVYDGHVVENSGTISTAGNAVTLNYHTYGAPLDVAPSVTNSGVIESTAGDAIRQYSAGSATITNTKTGRIVSDAGVAIGTGGDADTVRNDGEIVGAINLNFGDDRLENYGSITGAVNLADGNDTFVQWVGGAMNGTVDGSYGLDTLVIDSTSGGTISTSQFINFESFKQIGDGSLNYVGDFGRGPIVLDGNSAAVAAGDTVTTLGGVAFVGGDGSERVLVDGAIFGGVSLGGGGDAVTNHGAINGAVLLGGGDDTYTEGWASTVSGAIDGGDGNDTYILELAGDRDSLRSRSGFENLGVTGLGNLTLTFDQSWSSVSLAGANVNLTSGAYSVGRLSGSDQDEAVRIDADIAQVNLGGGADNLQVEFTQLAGVYSGGAGIDRVRFTAATPVTVSGSLSGFETIALDGGQMAVSGVLGAAGETTTFEGQAGQTLSILSGGALAGTVDLGAGDDLFQLAAGGQLLGTVLGGTGSDRVNIDLIADLSLRGDQLQQFETLQVTGTGALNFTGGAAKFDHLVTDSKDLTLAAGSSLNAGDLSLGGGANTMTVAGAFTGVVDLGGGDDVLRLTTGGTFTGSAQGGAGSDTLELALGGTDAAPTALGATPFNGFETLSLQSGVVSVSGDYGFDSIEVRNGRLIGLAGSRLAASTITVAQGATFGSAGAVTGNIAVAGTLSPGASPGTMTVTGNVALAAGSTALFEITPTVSDQLVVSGTVTIAQGSTLKLVGAAALTPGRRLDLITAGGGIVGAFSTIDGAQGLNLHIAQTATRLQAVGLFTTDTGFSSQVSGLIGTLNTALIADKVSAPLIAAFPALVDPATHKSDPRALARVTPQAYASATQLALEDGLSIVDASRAQARFAPETPGLFGFGQAIASRRTQDGDAALGVAKGKINVEGGLAGVGYGVDSAWAGVFVGYLNGRQRIRDLDVRTQTDSFAVGVQGQVRLGGFQLGAMAAHDGADVDTRRAAPGGTTATGDYKLKSWIADLNLTYRASLNADWAVQPRLGATYVRATRDGFVERGGGAFALTVQGDKSSTWFVDGQVELLGGQAAGARLHPFASLGFRSTADGGETTASGALAGLATPIRVGGLDRSGTLATAGAGAGYDLAPGLTASAAYAGEFGDGGRQALLVGLNWKF